jgi:hypothetical protein
MQQVAATSEPVSRSDMPQLVVDTLCTTSQGLLQIFGD